MQIMRKLDKYLLYGGVVLFAYMPFHIFLSQWLSTYTGELDGWKIGKDVFAALLTTLCVASVVLTKRYTRLYLWFVGIAAIYTALHLLLMLTTNQPHGTGLLATVYNTRLMWYVLIGYSLALFYPKWNLARYGAYTLVGLSTVVCVIALLQWILPKDIMTHFGYSIPRGVKPNFFIDDKPDLPRVFSTLRDPNSLGAFLILPATLIFSSLVRFWKTDRRTFFGGLFVLHNLIIFLTFSRSAFVGVFLAYVSVLWLMIGNTRLKKLAKRHLWPIVAIALVLILGIFFLKDQYIVQNVVFHSDENTKQTDSNNLHAIQIEKGIKGIKAHPEGNGPGTAGLVSVHRADGGLLTENYYIQIAYEIGVVGLLMLLGFFAVVVSHLWRLRSNRVAQALIASFVGISFMNFLLHTWANEAVAASWFMLSGLTLRGK